jgi:hypothetical protein
MLNEYLHPVKPVDHERLQRILADLDSDQFATREQVATELEKLGELAESELRRLL